MDAVTWGLVALVLALAGLVVLNMAWRNRTIPTLSPVCVATAGEYSASLDTSAARNSALIAGTASKRGLPPRAATIAIATAIQESKLHNITHGDRDSLGLFQQRPSQGWGSEEEIMDPYYSTGKFYDALVKVRGYQSMSVTDAAQTVQRSGFPEAYADHEGEGRAVAAALYGQFPAAYGCRLGKPENTESGRVGDDGLTARARVVATTVVKDLGEQRITPEGDDGTVLRLTFPAGRAGQAKAWGAAHWAVASAHEFDIVDVRVGDRRWTRADQTLEWKSTSGKETEVLIQVSGGVPRS